MRLKCCVGGCNATNETHRLFAFPKKDTLRNLWMSFLVPTNPLLLGLTKDQLLRKRVCEKHFDAYQFDGKGKRLRYSYPCLFTDDEITQGVPLAAVGTVQHALSDHNYFVDQDDEEDTMEQTLVIGRPGEDFHEHPSCSYSEVEASVTQNKGQDFEHPSCSYSEVEASVTQNKGEGFYEHPSCSYSEVEASVPQNKGEDFVHPSCSYSEIEASVPQKKDGTISIAGHNLSIFFDPPHLLKGLRNNFLNKNIIWEGKRASWKDIQFIYDIDNRLGHTRAIPKLTAHHVDPDKIKKMKVSVAAQVFSSRMAAMLKYTAEINHFHTGSERNGTMEATAEIIEFFDSLFDSVNGSPGGATKGKLRKAIKKHSAHHRFWVEAIEKLKKLQFEDISSKLAIRQANPRMVRVPSLEGWVVTLESFRRISKILFDEYGVEYYYPRNINQDPLENFWKGEGSQLQKCKTKCQYFHLYFQIITFI